MLSPSPVTLICALLLCLPLAIVFTTTPTNIHGGSIPNIPPTVSVHVPFTSQKYKSIKLKFTSSPPPEPLLNLAPAPVRKIPSSAPTVQGGPTKKSQTSPVILKPSQLTENDDDSLLRAAARVNAAPGLVKKIAFMFLTITPLHLAPLWELYFNQTDKNLFNIYIHADPSYPYDPPFSGVFARRVIPSKPAQRLTPTLIAAARRLLARALLDDPSNAMFALVSSSCIPIHSFNFTYKALIRSRRSFIEILNNEPGAYDRWAARGTEAMLPEVKLEDFRIGSQFWILTRKHARMVVDDVIVWSKFNRECEQWDICYPEEHYFPTLLSMRDAFGCVPATLTYVDWSGRSDGHPRLYTPDDVGPDLILSLRNQRPRYGDDGGPNGSDVTISKRNDRLLFARKFSADSLQPLMEIAKDVIFKD